ncbi:MAG: CreA family protein [Bdellovibrionales bacterium]|nr:CreA family protein [Bdellovibrionales bacterium]
MKSKLTLARKLSVVSLIFWVGGSSSFAHAEELGKVSYDFHWVTPNDKIAVEIVDDPEIKGISCYVSRPQAGGFEGTAGVADNQSDASISCVQVGPVNLSEANKLGGSERIFSERRSLVFKEMYVERFIDFKRQTVVYMVYTKRLTEGSPRSSISAVRIKPWSKQ